MHPSSTLVIFLILLAAGYLALRLVFAVIFPFRPCRRCGGRGTRGNQLLGGGFRQCTKCAGTGRSVRPGRRFLERLNTDPTGRLSNLAGDPRPTIRASRAGRRRWRR